MPLAAILCATLSSSDRPELLRGQIVFAAQTLVEYQARLATGAGANELFIMVDAVTPQLSRMVDRLIGDGIEVHLIRDMATLVRQLPRESDILLFADGMVVDQAHVGALAQAGGNALLVVEDSAATSHLERVDGQHRWGGVACLSPQTVFNTLDLIGDWDLVLTLLRASVQAGARRIPIPLIDFTEGRAALIDRQDTADLVARTLSAPAAADSMKAGAEYYLLGPVARLLAPHMLRLQIPPQQLTLAAAGFAVLGLLLIIPGWIIAALLSFMVAFVAGLIADHVAAMGRMTGRTMISALAPAMLSLAGVAWIGVQADRQSDGLYMALLSAVSAVAMLRKGGPALPPWAYMTPASAVLLLLAGRLAGILSAALALGVLLGIASLAAQLLLGTKDRDARAGAPGAGQTDKR